MDNIYTNNKFYDNRGSIYTIYDSRICNISFVQDKITRSTIGTIRGFHGDNETWKLITCLYGILKLITYDIDKQIKQEYLLNSEDNENISVLVPPRCLNAHQCISSECIFYYKWSEFYKEPEKQWSVNYNDKDINPNWDMSLDIIVSERDRSAKSLKNLMESIRC
jgi:dTDP-4-dehydrorhamnose 3,5-epimerase